MQKSIIIIALFQGLSMDSCASKLKKWCPPAKANGHPKGAKRMERKLHCHYSKSLHGCQDKMSGPASNPVGPTQGERKMKQKDTVLTL